MPYNKFTTTSGEVLLDLMGDSVTADTLSKGITAHNKHGEPIIGTNEGTVSSSAKWDGSCSITTENVISFSINGDIYQAIEGTTWGDWTATKYGSDYSIADDEVRIKHKQLGYLVFNVIAKEAIVAEKSYALVAPAATEES